MQVNRRGISLLLRHLRRSRTPTTRERNEGRRVYLSEGKQERLKFLLTDELAVSLRGPSIGHLYFILHSLLKEGIFLQTLTINNILV